MDKRLFKQLIIALIFLMILAGLGTGIFFALRPQPTCFDNKQNQGEEGVDCGGPCALSCEVKTLSPLTLSKVYSFLYQNRIDLVAQIFNPNENWGVKSFKYKFILYGDFGQIQEVGGSDFILPKESKLIVVPAIILNLVNNKINKIDFFFDDKNINWQKINPDLITLEAGELLPITSAKLIKPQTPSSAGQTFNFTLTLKKGMKSPQVSDLQKIFSRYYPDLYPGKKITGYFGNETLAALKKFQKKYNLPVTGIVDKATRAKLNELYGKKSATELSLEPYEAKLELTGSVFNKTALNWRKVYVVSLLCDKSNNPIAVGKVTIDNLNSQKSQPFSIRWYRDLADDLVICQKAAYTNIFDKDNILSVY